MLPKNKPIESKAIRRSAKGQDCQLRFPGICNSRPETVVFCHLPGSAMSLKNDDLAGAYGCSACHDVLDGRADSQFDRTMIKLWFWDGVKRTHRILYDLGIIKIEDTQ